MSESNTAYAQGGIAVAMGGLEDVQLHLKDTIAAGDGLVSLPAAEVLVREGPHRVEELLQWGTQFDRYATGPHAGELMHTREGAHSLPRILHADGDATGRAIAVALLKHVQQQENVELMEWATTVDLIVQEGRVMGVTFLDREGVLHQVKARGVLLATGGAGRVYSDTTNPAVATGDGIAMAWRAGAELMDMEFYQFHPTAFAQPGAPRFLLSEALRGEGAWLVNASGERFMERYDRRLELAPRDVVARAILRESRLGPVYLDMRHLDAQVNLKQRFPGISAFLLGYGLELQRDLIPIGPAAHYLMGGIRTDVHGRTNLPGLYAAGEAACTGVHGANRLASNSLLEGLVFGAKAAEAMSEEPQIGISARKSSEPIAGDMPGRLDNWVGELRNMMWHDVGLLRDGNGLARARSALERLRTLQPLGVTRPEVEARNLLVVAEAIVAGATGREESRGAHARLDFPQPAAIARHSILRARELRYEQLP